MMVSIDWEAIACCYGCLVEKLPEDLVEIIQQLDEGIKDANGIALVVLLYKKGILK